MDKAGAKAERGYINISKFNNEYRYVIHTVLYTTSYSNSLFHHIFTP